MKFNIKKAILAAATTLALTAGTLKMADIKPSAIASAESTQREYNIIVDTTYADVIIEGWDSTVSDIVVKSKFKAGETVFVSATAKPAYLVYQINYSGGGISGQIHGTKGAFDMPDGDVTITVNAANAFIVSPQAGDHVTVSISGTGKGNIPKNCAHYGDSISVTATPDSGYILTKLEVKTYGDDTVIASFPGGSGTFSMPAKPVIVVAEAEPAPPTAPTEPPTTPTEPTTPTTPTTPTEPVAPQYKKGDVNGDGLVNAADATLILKHCVQIITLDKEQLDRADVNSDGRVNAADATLILKMLVGLA